MTEELTFSVGDSVFISTVGEYGTIIAVDPQDPYLTYQVEWEEEDEDGVYDQDEWFSEDELSF